MSFPKFKVGEVVILDSTSHPQFNGEYTIHGISDARDKNNTYKYKGIYYEFGSSPKSMFAYDLGVNFLKYKDATLALECVLKKKHISSEMSFEKLMYTLKTPINEET